MIHERLTNLVKDRGDHYLWFAPGQKTIRFPYNEVNKAQVASKLNKLLERMGNVTDRELLRGVEKKETRPHSQVVREETKTWRSEPLPGNPHEKLLRDHDELHAPVSSVKDQIRQSYLDKMEQWEIAEEQRLEAEKLHSSPAYQARYAEAAERLVLSYYTPGTVVDHRRAEAMFEAAESGDRDRYKELHAEFTRQEQEKLAAADAVLAAEAKLIADARASLGKSDFETPEPESTPAEIESETTPND